jgi:superfamily II helicase
MQEHETLRTICTRCGKHNRVYPDLYNKTDSEIREEHVCDDCCGGEAVYTNSAGSPSTALTIDVVNPELVTEPRQ